MRSQPNILSPAQREEYIELARKTMGSIDLDPASNSEAQRIVKAKKYYDIEINGLNQV